MKVHQGPGLLQQKLPNKAEMTNPLETSPAETFKGVTNKENNPHGITRVVHTQETSMNLTNKETNTTGTCMGVTTQETQENNPHGIAKGTVNIIIIKEILENNPLGITKVVVTQETSLKETFMGVVITTLETTENPLGADQ